ncbi:MAG: hypothetical protein JWO38_7401 [Gemmataceae bacterium]|nr:hypothetical protein [Gemmataceae bacterium]
MLFPPGFGMDYHLQNVRTGEAHSLDAHGTLIGTADHAAIRTRADGPFLAALVVRYPTGWVVHGLSDDPEVTFNRATLGVVQRAVPQRFDVLGVGADRFRFVPRTGPAGAREPATDPPACFAFVRGPDGMEECRAVDHDLLFGRLTVCHVRFPDTKLSRLNALLAAHAGSWYVHNLAKRPIYRNRVPVTGFDQIEDGDELVIGPLVVRVEIRVADVGDATHQPATRFDPPVDAPARPAAPIGPAALTDSPAATDETADPFGPEKPPDRTALLAAGVELDRWLKAQTPTPTRQGGGIGGWLGAQRDRLTRFWNDTPETTAARGLRTAGKLTEAFGVLDRAIRARPDSPGLLRELYRLYEAAGLIELCYRPLRQVEKVAAARGETDTWVLETLARVCEQLGPNRPGMLDRAINYWRRLEAATGVSYARERAAVLATRALREGGFTGAAGEGA